MLYMVIERFRNGDWRAVGERFQREGRMIPPPGPDGVGAEFVTSWMMEGGEGCFQVMKAESVEALEGWMERWRDLVEFEVAEVRESGEWWGEKKEGQ